MAQFDVYVNESNIDPETILFLLDIQSDSLSDLRSRVVAPLRRSDAVKPLSARLNPSFQIAQTDVVLMIQEMLYLPTRVLGKRVTSLTGDREAIIRALDLLTVGF